MAGLSRISLVVVGISSLAFGGWITLGVLNGALWNSENWYIFYAVVGGPMMAFFGFLMTVDGLFGTNLTTNK